MGTKAAAFAGKISNLRESILRIQNGTLPQPTCTDLANMMKYCCLVLHDFRDFKDIENMPLYSREKRDKSHLLKMLPNFDYSGLYKTLIQLVDILPLIPQSSNGLEQLGSNLLMLAKCLVPFLDHENMETMPYLIATLFMSLPQALHKEVLDTLCFNLLPFTIEDPKQRKENKKRRQQISARLPTAVDTLNNKQEADRGDGGGGDDDYGYEVDEEDDYALLSVTSILMIAFHHISEPMHLSQLVECLMKFKSNVFQDLLYVIAYGTTRARCPAVELLFRYWPDICPNPQDRKSQNQSCKLKHISWLPTKCQNKDCSFTTLGDDEAVKMCLDFKISITLSDLPPPMLICLDCVDSIYKKQLADNKAPNVGGGGGCSDQLEATTGGPPATIKDYNQDYDRIAMMDDGGSIQALDDYSNKFIDLLLPMDKVSKLCENKKCKSTDRTAIGTCFDIECANYNCKKPIRYCRQCFVSTHEPCEINHYDHTLQNHIRHSSMSMNLMEDEESVTTFIEAIISLLKEAAPADRPLRDSERYLRSLMGPMSQFSSDNKDMNIATEEKQLISQYGIWLMTGLCKSVDKISEQLLGRLLGMLFQWFHFTACLPDDQAGSALEKLKGECIKGWIMDVKQKRLDVFISCLLPHPTDCSKIGGHWEVWPDTAHQIKEGFKRLLCLVPYDIITDDVWDEIMPYWMECFRHEVPENELSELKILLSKVFDPELSPLGFKTNQMYNFISSRFEDPMNIYPEQTLYWLQILTMLEIPIPIDFLYQMLMSGVKSLAFMRHNEMEKIRIANQLAEIEKLSDGRSFGSSSNTGSDSNTTNSDEASSGDTDSESEFRSEDERKLKMSNDERSRTNRRSRRTALPNADEDDVMLPAVADSKPVSRLLTKQERQAQARAAFSARILQHASMLDSSISSADSSKQSACVGQQQATPHQLAPSGQIPINQRAGSPGHTVPLKSVSSSISSTATVTKQTAGDAAADDDGQSHSEKARKSHNSHKRGARSGKQNLPKLKLHQPPTDGGVPSSVGQPDGGGNLTAAPELDVSAIADAYKVDNNLICYILMLDILLKQLDLQEINAHRGLDGKEAQKAIDLLNAIISTPWVGRHTCCDSLPANLTSGKETTTKGSTTSGGGGGDGDKSDSANNTSANVHMFSHTAEGFEQEDSYETCVFCEIISTFHQLSMFLIEFFSPTHEVSICEVSQDAANGEFDGKPDYSRIGLNHLQPSPSATTSDPSKEEFTFASRDRDQQSSDLLYGYNQFNQTMTTDPPSPFSPSYFGPSLKTEVLESLPKELQLAYNLLVQFHQYQTPDIVSQLLQMIKLISLHSQVLSKAAKNNPDFITWCQHNMLVGKLWSLCQLESSEIARTCVPLLLHCITLPWGVRLFRDLVERDFNSSDWLSRFRAVERVVTIAYFCEPSTIKNSMVLQSTMASAFCYVVRCLDDIEAIVAQRALVSLEMMKTSSLKLLLWCLEYQFDYIVVDRPMILRSVFQLYNHLRDRRFLTWEFFLNRFDTIFLEAQIYLQQTGEIPSFTMQDLKNTNTKSEAYQKKIVRAKEALQETHHSRSLSIRFNRAAQGGGGIGESASHKQMQTELNEYRQSLKMQRQMQLSVDTQMDTATELGPLDSLGQPKSCHIEKRRLTSPIKRVLQHGKSTSSRYQSVAYLTSQALVKRKNSKFMSNLAMQSVPPALSNLPDKLHQHLPNSFVDDGSKLNEIAQENHVFGVVHRIYDEDRDTNHSLIFLLMQFFSKPDPSHPQTIKTLNRSHQIVLRHLNILMGYSIARKNFLITASNLRLLPVFNAFLTSLPKVLDFNYSLGTILLDSCLPVLVYCPATEDVQYDSIKSPTYSLWLLNPLMRQSWLMSVMTFLYKYQFSQAHLKDQVYMLMWIVVNTLESHLNCSNLDAATLDRCLINVRDSTATVQAQQSTAGDSNQSVPVAESSQEHHPHVKVQPVGDAAGSPIQQPQQQTDSLQRVGGGGRPLKAVVTSDESNPRPDESVQLAPSNSNGSLKQTTAAAAAPLKPLLKADTSDSLNVKAKLFQRRSDSPKISKISSAGSSTTKINQFDSGEGSNLNLQQQQQQQLPEQRVPLSVGDERLLPIGFHRSQQKARSAFDLPATERLLPIGLNQSSSQKQHGQQMAEQQMVVEGTPMEKHETTKSSDSLMSPKSWQQKDQKSPDQPAPPGAAAADSPEQTSSSKKSRGRFGVGGKQASIAQSSDSAITAKATTSSSHHLIQSASIAAADGLVVASNSNSSEQPAANKPSSRVGAFVGAGRRGKTNKQQQQGLKEYNYNLASTIGGPNSSRQGLLQPSFSCPSLLNEQLAQINRHSFVQEFSDKDLSMCLVILETFIHHEPSMAAPMLPNILRLVARYSSSSLDGVSGQSGSGNIHPVGGSMFVARQFIRVALHDLMENNIFHQIFTSHFTGYEFYKSMATALADFPDLNQLAPLSKLFEDLIKQKNLPQASSLMTILENVATYFECIIAESSASPSQATWNTFITNWENFLRKLILALPRYSGSNISTTTTTTTTTCSASANQATGGGGPGSRGAASSGADGRQSAAGGTGIDMTGQQTSSSSGVVTSSANYQSGFLASKQGNQQQQQQGQSGAGPAEASTQNNNNNSSNQASANAIPSSCSMIMAPIMRIILSTSKVSQLASCKTIADPYSKIISYTVLNSQFKYEHLLEINHNCCRLYTRDREKYLIQRSIAYELVQVLKFRFFILEENLLVLLLFILQDVGGSLSPKVLKESLRFNESTLSQADNYVTNVSECLRQYIGDMLEFITDVHAISRINDNLIGPNQQPSSINRDSFGGQVKAAISQYLALEISLTNGSDNRAVLRYLPWLYTSPSLQQGPREFIECVSHIRQLSWIILGALQHRTMIKFKNHKESCSSSSMLVQHGHSPSNVGLGCPASANSTGIAGQQQQQSSSLQQAAAAAADGQQTSSASSSSSSSQTLCQPIPIEKNGNVAEHVQVILAGFAEQSKESVLHMSGLFHAFLLCQLWTMYCETICYQHAANSEQYQFCQSTLDDFWAKITPGVLRLVGHSRVMSEMVSTHFLQLIESLIESNSSILIRYLPMWNSVFYSYKRRNKSGNLAIRLQKCTEWQPPDLNSEQDLLEQSGKRLMNWLEKVQYKMSHIEIQSSQAAPFYLT